jgi:arylsulfatase A-like enzyme
MLPPAHRYGAGVTVVRGFVVFAVLFVGLLGTPAGAEASDAQAAEPPNIVLVVTDDQRWDTLSAMPTVSSELVGQGVTFRNAFVVNPLCCPSRAAILTGTYSHTNGVWSNSNSTPYGGARAFDDRATLATWLDEAGYETMLVGKYMNGYGPPLGPPFVPPGWDRWLAFFGSHGYFRYSLTDGASVRSYGPERVEANYSTDVLAAEAEAFVRSAPSPFFLYFAPFAPHKSGAFSVEPAPRHVDAFAGAPYTPPPSVNEADVGDKPGFIRRRSTYEVENLTELREEQLEALLAVDEAVAGLLTALDDAGKLENTLFLFTSDNGHTWGEHRWAGKRVAYDESIRVPLVARWDALALPPREVGRPVLNIDLASTITDAAGAEVPGRDGRSLIPLLSGDNVPWRSKFLIEYFDVYFPSYCSIRTEGWKYVQHRTGEEELYDLLRDPLELRNLAGKPTRRTKVMESRANVQRSACRPPNGYQPLRLCSSVGTDRGETIRGTEWRDWICAGGGRDVIRVRGGSRDVVRCGPGRDTVYASQNDTTRGCERVIVR